MSGNPPLWARQTGLSTEATPDVRALRPDEVDHLLARLNLPRPALDLAGLTALQWRSLCAAPFHNLDLLAGRSPETVETIIAAVLAGRGGPCHVQATAFLALLRGLGFRAWLAAATIGAPGDHLVCLVEIDGATHIADVGNGHPYRRPFLLDGRVDSEHLGWIFAATGDGRRLTLDRRLDDGSWRRVYTVDPTPRAFADFAHIIGEHHRAPGFGPFLTGLRTALIREEVVITLRDLRYRRDHATGARERPVADLAAARRVLHRVFGLADDAVDAALDRLAAPATTWIPLPPRPPRVAVTISTTDRPAALAALLADLAAEWQQTTARAAPPLVVVVENSRDPEARAANRATLAAHAAPLECHLIDDGTYGRPIAASRAAQTAALGRLIAAGVPSSAPVDAVWMLDDDLRLAQLRVDAGVLHTTHAIRYFDRIADAWNHSPEAALLVGRVCGDPPIRPDAVLATGLLDVAHNLDRFAQLDPERPYHPPTDAAIFALPDYYYDHSEAGETHLYTPFAWLPRAPGTTTRAEALACIRALRGLFAGKAPTRPLLDDEPPGPLRGCRQRGGHAIFLDVDAALRHRYPCVTLGDGTITRRADMIGATRLDREGGTWVAALPWPVLHHRDGLPLDNPLDDGLTDLRSEFFGVLLARAVMNDGDRVDSARLADRARDRRRRIIDRFTLARDRAHLAAAALDRAHQSWLGHDPAIAAALTALAHALARCPLLARDPATLEAALDVPADLDRIARFVEGDR